VTELFQLKIVY